MKTKDQSTQKVNNYLTHLQTYGNTSKAIHINHRQKFVNDSLLEWLYLKGMEVHMTLLIPLPKTGLQNAWIGLLKILQEPCALPLICLCSFGNKPSHMWHMFITMHIAPLWGMLPHMSNGMERNLTSLTFANLAHLSRSCSKARRCYQKWNLVRGTVHWLGMMTVQN